ncbi:extracellular solute-binding protein [Streptomyces sodiiphilus]|uniref:Extracellular solute-binding protein n=1 Tax=Streptomyces sodiiphilus TaxID=226217 RepID=A0ABP5AS32_9ACTN
MFHRRERILPALMIAGALTLTAACGGGDNVGSDDGDGQVTLRFSWWGNDSRHELTQQAIDLFEEKNPDITVEPEFSDWDSYYDRLTTQMASGKSPDVFAVEIRRLGEFATRGTLADVGALVNTGDLNEEVLASGNVNGTQYAVPTGANTFAVTANLAVLEDAGVEPPDDATWTWDDYIELSAEITEATGAGVYGTQLSYNDAYLNIFAAQRGESVYTDDGLGVSAETVADWYRSHLGLIDAQASPDAATSTEIGSTGIETSLVATNQGALGMWWSNQLSAITAGSGEEIELLRMPKDPGAVSGGMFLQPTMFWTVSENSERKEAAGKLIDFLVNDPEAGAILGSDRGLPMNATVLAEIESTLPEPDRMSLEFINTLGDELSAPEPPPTGAGEIPPMLERYGEEVIFDRMSPQEAAEAFIAEASSTLG